MNLKDVEELLRAAYFFRNLPDEPLKALADACGQRHVPQGEVVFSEGERGDRFYVVIAGQVDVWKNAGQTGATKLATHGPGHIFGEMALVDNLPRSATAVTSADTDLLFLVRDQFESLVKEYPSVAISVMRSLSAIVRHSNDSFVADLNYRNRKLEEAYRQLQKAQDDLLKNERLSNLGKFSNMVLHDIRNPVSVLRGYAQALLTSAGDPEQVRDYANRISVETDRLSQLSGELLDYVRGEIRLDLSVVKPSYLVDEAVRYSGEQVKKKHLTVNIEVDSDQPVMADKDRIVRALVNVVENACKASRDGGRIDVSVLSDEESVAIRVEDNGIGMEPDVVEKVFEPFFSRSDGGTGLGMVIVKTVVEAHHGTLLIESSPGEGTEVLIRIPRRVAGSTADTAREARSQS